MLTVEDLGRKIRTIDPYQFADLTDAEIGRAAKRAAKERGSSEFESFQDVVAFTTPYSNENQYLETDNLITNLTDKNVPLPILKGVDTNIDYPVQDHIQTLLDCYHPSKGVFNTWRQERKILPRISLLGNLLTEHRLVIELGAVLEQEVMNGKRLQADYQQFIATHQVTLLQLQHTAKLTQTAYQNDLTVENDQLLKVAQKQSDIKVSEHQQFGKIDLDNKLLEMQEEVRLAIIAKYLSNEQIISAIQEQIDNAYKQIHDINTKSHLSPELKRRMIEDREEIIAAFKVKRNERQTRLVETGNRGNIRTDDTEAEL